MKFSWVAGLALPNYKGFRGLVFKPVIVANAGFSDFSETDSAQVFVSWVIEPGLTGGVVRVT